MRRRERTRLNKQRRRLRELIRMRKVGEKTLLKIIYIINNRLYKEKGGEEVEQTKKKVERADEDEKGRIKTLLNIIYIINNKLTIYYIRRRERGRFSRQRRRLRDLMRMRKVGENTLLKIIYIINNRFYEEKGEEEAEQMKKEVDRADDDEKGRRKDIIKDYIYD